jgi:hypothetical protein
MVLIFTQVGVDHPRSSAKLSSFRVFSPKVEESSSTVLALAEDPKSTQPCHTPSISTWRSGLVMLLIRDSHVDPPKETKRH